MHFVFDTNTLVSSVLKPHGVSARAYARASSIGQLVFSSATVEELSKVLNRPKFDRYCSAPARQEALATITDSALMIVVAEEADVYCRDEKDAKFLQVALAAQAACLVSGDKDLLELHPFRNIPIMNAADFLQNFTNT
ncbi:MAG: putative toxin-antitoxin system toxin component, PIN family [Bacteroidota bacterium]